MATVYALPPQAEAKPGSMSVSVMGHPSRQHFIDLLLPQLPGAEVVLDRIGDRWDTGRRALLAHVGTGSEWSLIVQDDALLCRDFLPAAQKAAQAAGERPVSLYIGSLRPHQRTIRPALKEARKTRTPWIACRGPYWGVGLVIPTAHIPDLVAWSDKLRNIHNYDRRIERWYTRQRIACWYTVPSLVDHRPVAENPSLVKGRDGDRRAHYFARNPSRIDWTRPPLEIRR